MRIKIGITMGDPSGIGPEIIAKAVRSIRSAGEIVIIGDGGVFSKVTRAPASQSPGIQFIDLKNVKHKGFKFGKIRAEYGRASIEYLDKAIALLKSGAIDCLVTCPISKESINLAGFHYSGHTEYLAERAKMKNVVMMLLNEKLKFSLVTRHVPLKDVPCIITRSLLTETISETYDALRGLFGIAKPRLVVCGINPHASDNGIIGDEEIRVVNPALKSVRLKGMSVLGPLSADIAIAEAARGKYDAVIAMYHDQALIPLKLTGAGSGVNLTLGLPFIRTSPLHGTAFAIAGKNAADSSSLTAAIKLAARCSQSLKKA